MRAPGTIGDGRRSALPWALPWLSVATIVTACAAPAPDGGRPTPLGEALTADSVPAGFGTLRQDEITISLRSGDLLVKVTPLYEPLLRLTAPDTYERLRRLRDSEEEQLLLQAGSGPTKMFYVSFFTYQPNVTFQPEDLHLFSLGLRYRPMAIVPITQGWGAQRLDQRETQSALYAFDGVVSLDTVLEVEYDGIRGLGWDRVLVKVEAERSRVRARASRGTGWTPSADPQPIR